MSVSSYSTPRLRTSLTAPSEAIDMLGLSRALLTLLVAVVVSQFFGLAWTEPAKDRPFFARWIEPRLAPPRVSCMSGKTIPRGPHSAVRG
jgi:hypothetical protein